MSPSPGVDPGFEKGGTHVQRPPMLPEKIIAVDHAHFMQTGPSLCTVRGISITTAGLSMGYSYARLFIACMQPL